NAADLGGAAILENVCSYTSNNGVDPNGICKDCVVQGGLFRIIKHAVDANGNTVPAGSPPMFDFTLTSCSPNLNASVLGSDQALVPLANGTYSIAENLPGSWAFDSVSCIDNFGNSVGTAGNASISGVTLTSGLVVICTFNNHEVIGASLHITKTPNVS